MTKLIPKILQKPPIYRFANVRVTFQCLLPNAMSYSPTNNRIIRTEITGAFRGEGQRAVAPLPGPTRDEKLKENGHFSSNFSKFARARFARPRIYRLSSIFASFFGQNR